MASSRHQTPGLLPAVDLHGLEPIAEELSVSSEENDAISSFQQFLQDDHEQEEISDSHGDSSSSDSNNDIVDLDIDTGSELSDEEPIRKRLQELMSWKTRGPQNAGGKKPGPKPLSRKQGRSTTNIPDVDAYDPRTCGKYFLF